MIGKWMRVFGLCLMFLVLLCAPALAGAGPSADCGDAWGLMVMLGVGLLLFILIKIASKSR